MEAMVIAIYVVLIFNLLLVGYLISELHHMRQELKNSNTVYEQQSIIFEQTINILLSKERVDLSNNSYFDFENQVLEGVDLSMHEKFMLAKERARRLG